MKKLIVAAVLFSLIGAGCDPASRISRPATSEPTPVAAQMGFGKLPTLGDTVQLRIAESISARPSAVASPVPAPATAPMMTSGNAVSSDMMIGRPIPIPPPLLKPANVKYNLTATMPTFSTDGDVLEVARVGLDANAARGMMSGSGLPSQLISDVKDVQTVQTSWISGDGYIWTAEIASHSLTWWKNMTEQTKGVDAVRPEEKPRFTMPEDAKIIAVSDAFLRSRGLGFIADQGASVYRYNQPCVMMEAKTMIYPSPCDTSYVPQVVDVYYGTMREGRTVVDMSGYPARYTNVGVDIKDMIVTHGNVPFAETIRRSSYALLDQATVLERLKTGGRNPVYPWGGESKDIVVNIEKVELAWLRHDVYADGKQQTYYIPAIAASGTVDRGIKDQEKEEYYTTVALVKDDAFEETVPQPVPIMVPLMEGREDSPERY